MEVTHLLNADDTMVFCEAEQEQICYLRVILVIFEACSRLKINWRKSNIFPVKEVQQIQPLADILRCRIEDLPIIYLGMPLNANHKAVNIWDGIIEKSQKRLALWKSQYLSLGGRVVLINVVLDSLPTYVMCLFPIPSEVVKILDKLRRDFLWQGSKIEKSFNLVKWSAVQQSKSFGGLGVRNLKLYDKSLLIKWLWRFTQANQSLWREIILHKYGPEGQSWLMLNILQTCLAVGSEEEEAKAKKYGGEQSQPASGGPFGRS
ncbi:uncharacterized protein LOC125856458 [Solanum stenotomum]|uniref:uncharacterized protein LOC125856458 n=1 Tax=Solanum stenotomum TaxID=172797 RepID=UPI0020D04C25|nr:uncharacterized protein LOC125856458 [Solanum stenotomum]